MTPGTAFAPRRRAPLWALAAALLVQAAPAAAATESPPGPDAVAAVRVSLEIERELLRENIERYDRFAASRTRALAQLAEFYRSLDAAVRGSHGEAMSRSMQQVEQAEDDRTRRLAAERALIDRIAEGARRVDLLETRLSELEQGAEVAAQPLSGDWRVSLLPLNQRGTFTITQNGTLLLGTYTLDGGWTGSLQGTLVNRKVYLVRIDSKLGRSMEFEGYLTADGNGIRGTWLNYELAGRESANGLWTAVRSR